MVWEAAVQIHSRLTSKGTQMEPSKGSPQSQEAKSLPGGADLDWEGAEAGTGFPAHHSWAYLGGTGGQLAEEGSCYLG